MRTVNGDNNARNKKPALGNSVHFDAVTFLFYRYARGRASRRRMNGERNAPNAKIITSLAVELAGSVSVRSMTVHGDINDNYKTIFPARKSANERIVRALFIRKYAT